MNSNSFSDVNEKKNTHAFSSDYGYLMMINQSKYYYLGIEIWKTGTKDRRRKKRKENAQRQREEIVFNQTAIFKFG